MKHWEKHQPLQSHKRQQILIASLQNRCADMEAVQDEVEASLLYLNYVNSDFLYSTNCQI